MPDSGELMGALMRRVERARAESERAIARSVLVTARRALAETSTLVRRCAWCRRLLLAGVWVPEDEVPEFVGRLLDERTTHGICDDCIDRLERDGVSRTRTR